MRTYARRRCSILLERMRLALENPAETARVKLMVVDEAWRYLRDPAVLSYLAEAAKTWRKKNAALDYGDAKRRGRDRHRRSRGVARIHADQAFPRQPGAAGQGGGHLSPESVRGGHHTRFDSEARAVSAAAGGGRQTSTRSGPGKLLALYQHRPATPRSGRKQSKGMAWRARSNI